MKKRMPWDGLLRRLHKRRHPVEQPLSVEKAPATSFWSLENIPVEIVHEIVSYLGWLDRAVLALASKTMLIRLGKDQLRSVLRYDLLRRLERDGAYPEAVLCPCCCRFHSPLLSLQQPGQAASIRIRLLDWGNGRAATPNLPAHLHFNMVAAVMRCHRNGWDKYTPLTLATGTRHRAPDGLGRMSTWTQCHVVRGRLILTEQRLVMPVGGAGESRRLATARLGAFLDGLDLASSAICGHRSWRRDLAWLLDRDLTDTERDSPWRKYNKCAWTHSQPCRRRRSPALGPLGGCGGDLGAARVDGCSNCHTDYAWTMVDLPRGRGRVLALGTWKDLGAGEDLADERWRSHLRGEPAKGVPRRKMSEWGDIFRALMLELGVDWRSYRPQLEGPCLDDLMD